MTNKSSESNILHFGAVRLRVTGSGSLIMYLRSLDNVKNTQLASYTMNAVTDIEPLVLANFVNQRGQFHLKTTEINETFKVSKIVIFTKQIYTGYPQ